MPRGFIKNIKLTKSKVGPERRQEILDDIDNQGTFLPRGVGYGDMDKSLVDMVGETLNISIDGKKVPVIFLTIQRWAEFSKTWQDSDEYGNINPPFITIVRRPDIQVGTNQGGNWNETGIKKYAYVKVPTFENGRKGVDLYKIPQPTSVNITYEVRLFCNRMRDLNDFNSIVQHTFQSRQFYVNPNGHPMPIHLERITDESNVEDFENRRFYIQLFELELLGYLLDEDKFEIIPTVSRMKITEEIITTRVKPKITTEVLGEVNSVNYHFIIKQNVQCKFKFTTEFDIIFNTLTINNLDSVIFNINGITNVVPFTANAGDTITVKFVKNANEGGDFTLNGILL